MCATNFSSLESVLRHQSWLPTPTQTITQNQHKEANINPTLGEHVLFADVAFKNINDQMKRTISLSHNYVAVPCH